MLVSSSLPLCGPQIKDWLAVCLHTCLYTYACACVCVCVCVCVCMSHLQLHEIVTKIGTNFTLLLSAPPNFLGVLYKVRQNALCGGYVCRSSCV